MKKTNLTKLTVERETLRALTSIELTRAAGGDEPFSGAALCPAPVNNNTNAATCLGTVAIATPPRG